MMKKMDECSKRLYCQNGTCTGKDTGECFIAPRKCYECPVDTHCANKELPGTHFELIPGSFTPSCFKGFVSSK